MRRPIPDIQWQSKTFHQLTVDQLFDLLQLRIDVFVVEQQCAYRELDKYDRHTETRHLSGRNADGELVAYTRIVPPGQRFPEVNIGRFVVKSSFRNQGLGHQLILKAIQEVGCYWPDAPLKIAAQSHLHKFYGQYGFLQISDGYLEDGIPHVDMLKKFC